MLFDTQGVSLFLALWFVLQLCIFMDGGDDAELSAEMELMLEFIDDGYEIDELLPLFPKVAAWRKAKQKEGVIEYGY